MLATITRLFPVWALLLSAAAYFSPPTFTPLGKYITQLLTLIMLTMGVTLTIDDFKRIIKRPAPVAAGIILHYLVMPLAAWVMRYPLQASVPIDCRETASANPRPGPALAGHCERLCSETTRRLGSGPASTGTL